MLYPQKFTEALYATPVGVAVLPLREVAMQTARDRVAAKAAKVYAAIEAAGGDVNVSHPYPNRMGYGTPAHTAAKALHSFALAISETVKDDMRMNGRHIVKPSPTKLAKVQEDAAEFAAGQYDAFAAKLAGKIGEHSAATLEGDHVWGESFLTVETPAGREIWKTKQIWNVSKLGNEFPQWPSRKVKTR